jgi:molecular chaperone GrpE (heat shock protein)
VSEEKNNVRNESSGKSGASSEDVQKPAENLSAGAEQLEYDMDTLRLEAEENRDRLLRLAAEFEN